MLQDLRHLLCFVCEAAETQVGAACNPARTCGQGSTNGVVTRRAEELLCAVDDRLEWLHEEDVDTSNDCLPVLPKHMDVMCPIITIEEAHECPWSE